MNRLLTIAEFFAGSAARHRVFEPLIADWQRELQHASTSLERFRVIVSGSFGFLRALTVCAVIDGVWIPPLRATLTSFASIALAISISIGVLLIAPIPQSVPLDLSEPFVQRWILVWLTILLPPVFVLGTYLLRRDTRGTHRHAVVFTMLAVAATTTVVVNTTDEALRKRYDTFENQERMRALALARHRAGIPVYSGNRYNEESRTTVAERRANFERFRSRFNAYRASQPPPSWGHRLAEARPVLLAVIFCVMGWTLAAFGHPTVPRAFGWWALSFAATISLTRIFWLIVQVPMPRTPQWLMPALFVSIACALAINAIRSRHSMRSS